MSDIVDFNKLKYNLYDILNVSNDVSYDIIKKTFKKVIKKFHPDKNNELEEEIYLHIIIANKVLCDENMREKYDYYLKNKESTYIELKNKFNENKNIEYNTSDFKTEMNRLNNIHGYSNYNENENIINKFNNIKNNFNTKPNIINNTLPNNFNKLFENNNNNNTIIEYKEPSELSTYIMGEYYTNINDINKLYVEDDIECDKYTNLKRAFTIELNLKNNYDNNKSYDDKINEYKNLTNELNNIKFPNIKTI